MIQHDQRNAPIYKLYRSKTPKTYDELTVSRTREKPIFFFVVTNRDGGFALMKTLLVSVSLHRVSPITPVWSEEITAVM